MNAAQVIRVGVLRRNLLLLLFACLATFVSVIVLFRSESPAVPAFGLARPARQEVTMALPPVPQAPGTAPTSSISASAPTRLNSPTPAPEAYAADLGVDQVSTTSAEAHLMPAEISGAADADARATAIRQLDPGAADTLIVLEQTVRNDPVARNRLLAVNSLRLMAIAGRKVDQVRPLLQAAMADADANVATSARDACQELNP
ncbi:MAG TPA: hypothetical protein VE046_15665 [Steroidobacteraceae bacterium]|nr:hypothetical protein [Steroidobacteraceae bacterium]